MIIWFLTGLAIGVLSCGAVFAMFAHHVHKEIGKLHERVENPYPADIYRANARQSYEAAQRHRDQFGDLILGAWLSPHLLPNEHGELPSGICCQRATGEFYHERDPNRERAIDG